MKKNVHILSQYSHITRVVLFYLNNLLTTTMATIAAVPRKFNIFTSLPDDLIREVCEWDDTYRTVFSSKQFTDNVLNAYWTRNDIQKKIKNHIYNTLELYQEEQSQFANRFLEMNFDDICDGTVYFVNQTEGMTPEEIDALPGKTNDVCRDLRKETTVYFSLFQDVLRWVIIPKTFASKADEYFKRCETDGCYKYLYDGMCTLEFDNVDTGRYSIYSKTGKVKPVLDACNVPIYTVIDYWHRFNDPIEANILSRMSNMTFNSVIQGTSTRKFVLWI